MEGWSPVDQIRVTSDSDLVDRALSMSETALAGDRGVDFPHRPCAAEGSVRHHAGPYLTMP